MNKYILNVDLRKMCDKDNYECQVMSKPEPLGLYSVSPEGFFELGGKWLQYFVEPPAFPLALNARVTDEPDCHETYLDNIFYFIKRQSSNFVKPIGASSYMIKADVVCTREVLQLMMCAHYEKMQNWTLLATKFRNTIYICRDNESGVDDFHKLMRSQWLRNLGQYCLRSGDELNQGAAITHSERKGECYCVFSTDMKGTRVIFDAPVTAKLCSNKLDDTSKCFAALKLRASCMNQEEWIKHKRTEAIKWWAECFLTAIDDVYVGLHDINANVTSIENTTQRSIYKECVMEWSTGFCLNSMSRIVNAIRNAMSTMDCPSTVFLYEFDAKSCSITYSILKGRNMYTFVPDWFRNMMNGEID